MKQCWSASELTESWTLSDPEKQLLDQRTQRRHPSPIRHTLLTAFFWQRRQSIIDGLVELLIQIVHRVSVNVERRVVTEVVDGPEEVPKKCGAIRQRVAQLRLSHCRSSIPDTIAPTSP